MLACQVSPDHALPDHVLAFQTPPDHVDADASATASVVEISGMPKMSCSPVSVTPFCVTWS